MERDADIVAEKSGEIRERPHDVGRIYEIVSISLYQIIEGVDIGLGAQAVQVFKEELGVLEGVDRPRPVGEPPGGRRTA